MNTSRKSDGTELPDGWRMVRMGDVADVRSGIGFPIDRQGRETGTYPFIKVSDMNLAGNEKYIRFANNYVEQLDAAELGGTPLPEGTVIFPKVGAAIATNKKRILTTPTLIDNNMVGISLVSQEICDSRYLFYWFETVDLSSFANVSAVPSITGSRLKQVTISLPPLHEQFSIADVLDSIDDAIERTEAVITATETLSDSLLHELLTCGVPGWHTEWKDVPGIGTIPADWEVVRGDAIFKLGGGCAPSDFEFVDNGAALFIKVNDLNIKGQSRYVRTSQLRWNQDGSKFKPIPPPVIVFPKRGAAIFINRVAIVQQLSVVDPNLMTVTALNGLNIEFLRYLLLQIGLHRLCDNSGIPQINNKHLYPKLFALPGFKERDTIAAALERVNGTLDLARKHRDGLKSLKESTAAELLTGKVRMHG